MEICSGWRARLVGKREKALFISFLGRDDIISISRLWALKLSQPYVLSRGGLLCSEFPRAIEETRQAINHLRRREFHSARFMTAKIFSRIWFTFMLYTPFMPLYSTRSKSTQMCVDFVLHVRACVSAVRLDTMRDKIVGRNRSSRARACNLLEIQKSLCAYTCNM